MLVVSRKQNQSVVFPHLGITVDILRVAGKTVSVGVSAPSEISILRGELHVASSGNEESSRVSSSKKSLAANVAAISRLPTSDEMHRVRNQLNRVCLALNLLRKQLELGSAEAADRTLSQALASFAELDQLLANQRCADSVTNPAIPAQPSRSRRALLVEDDGNERELLASYMRLCGFEVDTAIDGLAALEYLQTTKPDAVVLDMNMPRLDGAQTVQHIRRNRDWDDIELFVVSGESCCSMNIAGRDHEINRWFQKPLRPELLVEHLETVLN